MKLLTLILSSAPILSTCSVLDKLDVAPVAGSNLRGGNIDTVVDVLDGGLDAGRVERTQGSLISSIIDQLSTGRTLPDGFEGDDEDEEGQDDEVEGWQGEAGRSAELLNSGHWEGKGARTRRWRARGRGRRGDDAYGRQGADGRVWEGLNDQEGLVQGKGRRWKEGRRNEQTEESPLDLIKSFARGQQEPVFEIKPNIELTPNIEIVPVRIPQPFDIDTGNQNPTN